MTFCYRKVYIVKCYFIINTVVGFGVVSIALSERGIQDSFSRVKNDINGLKRAINRQILEGEEIRKSVSVLATKDEFYSFVNTLKGKIDAIEGNFSNFAGREKSQEAERQLREEISSLRKEFGRIDSLRDELLEARKLKDSFAKLEARAVDKKELILEIKNLNAEISEIKKEASKAGKYEKYREDIAELGRNISLIEKQHKSMEELYSTNKKLLDSAKKTESEIKNIKQILDALSETTVPRENYKEEIKSLKGLIEKIGYRVDTFGENYALKKDIAKRIAPIAEEVIKVRKAINELKGAEIDIEDLVTKKQLYAALKQGTIKEFKDENVIKLEKKIKEIGEKLALAEGKKGSSEEAKKLEKELNEIKKDISDALKEQDTLISDLRGNLFSASRDYENRISKVKGEIKELSKAVDSKVYEVRKDIVEAAKQLIKDLDKRVSQRLEKIAPEAKGKFEYDFSIEISELRKKISKLEGKGYENLRKEFVEKLDETEELLLKQIEETAVQKVKELESRFEPVDRFTEGLDKRFNRIEEKIEEEKNLEEFRKILKNAEEKGLKEAEKRIKAAEEKTLREIQQAARISEDKISAKIKELESKLKKIESGMGKESPDYEKLVSKVKEIEEALSEALEDKELEQVEKKLASRIDEIEEELGNVLERTKTEQIEKKLSSRIKEIEKTVEGGLKDKRIEQMEKEHSQTRKEVQEILKVNIKEIERISSEIQKTREQIKAKTAPKELKELADMRKEVDYLLNNIVTNPDMDAQVSTIENRLSDLRKELKNYDKTAVQRENELMKRIAALEKKLAEKRQAEAKKETKQAKDRKGGFFRKIFAAIGDFFKEEEKAEKVEIKEIREVKEEIREAKKEIRKEEKPKKEKWEEFEGEASKEQKIEGRPGTLKYILAGIIMLLLIGGAAYYLLRPPEIQLTPDEACILSYECKLKEQNSYWFDCAYNETQQSCKCYVGDYSECDSEKVAELEKKKEKSGKLPTTVYSILDYKFYILGVVIMMLIILYLITRSPKEQEQITEEEEEEEAIDLNEFLEKGAAKAEKKKAEVKKAEKEEKGKKEEKEKKKKGFLGKIRDFFFEEE